MAVVCSDRLALDFCQMDPTFGVTMQNKKKSLWQSLLVVVQGTMMTVTPAIISLSSFPIQTCSSGLSAC